MMRGPGPREVEKQILAELTKDQQARWEKLIGARYSGPFHFGRRGGPPRPYLQPLPDRPPMKGDQ
jgi:hypothetical protein